MEHYTEAFRRYADFSGRATRMEFWMFVLISNHLTSALQLLEITLGLFPNTPLFVLASFYSLAALIPTLSVSCRRLHDIGKSGWLQLLYLLPCLGVIILLVFFIKESDSGRNAYG